MAFLETKDVVKQYSGHLALDKVGVQIPERKIFGLLGPNGAGKTTLIRIITRIIAPDYGEVLFKNHPLSYEDTFNTGYLPEERGLYRKMKVGEQVIYLARLKGLSASDAKSRLKMWFEKFDILSWRDKNPEELSKGMQQKVQFIVAVIHDPELLIFDEPFSGFDPVNTELFKHEILQLKAQGKTVIFSTHDMVSVEEICDEIALINKSKVVLSGDVNQIRNDHKQHIFRIRSENANLITDKTLCEILSHEKDARNHLFGLKKNADISNSEFLYHLVKNNEITSFEEVIPSMNEIFIQTIRNS
jgi:ABC-2 type transport system ATP-binding protein